MISLKNITKFYDNIKILDELNLEIREKEKIIITGVSGSGKTTLLKIIATFDKNFKGDYQLNSKNINSFSQKEIASFRCEFFSMCFQENNLLEEETVYENVVIPLIYSKKLKKTLRKSKVIEVLKILKIENLKNKKLKTLSGGEKQRVKIAKALVNDPKVLLLDEITNSLSEDIKNDVINYLLEFTKEKTVIVVTHDESFIKILKNNKFLIYKMKNGKIN